MLWLFYQVKKYTAINSLRLAFLYKSTKALDVLKIPGDIVECGVYNGGSAAVLAYASKQSKMHRKIWLFDSFRGLPKPTAKNGKTVLEYYRTGWLFKGEVSKVKEIFGKLQIKQDKIYIIEGWFEKISRSIKIPQIAILHIDVDWYKSVNSCLNKFYDSVVPRGFVILDDFEWSEGCKKATMEFIKKRNLKAELLRVDSTSAYYFQKPAQE